MGLSDFADSKRVLRHPLDKTTILSAFSFPFSIPVMVLLNSSGEMFIALLYNNHNEAVIKFQGRQKKEIPLSFSACFLFIKPEES